MRPLNKIRNPTPLTIIRARSSHIKLTPIHPHTPTNENTKSNIANSETPEERTDIPTIKHIDAHHLRYHAILSIVVLYSIIYSVYILLCNVTCYTALHTYVLRDIM